MANALLELVRAGLTPEQILSLGVEAERRRQALLAQGFDPLVVDALTGPQLFSIATSSLPVVTGQDEIDRELEARIAAETALAGRMGTGLSLLEYYRQLAAERAAAERSPFRFIDFLRNVSELPGGTTNVVQALIGANRYIQPQLPTRDPNEERLIQRLVSYATPPTFETERTSTAQAPGAPTGVTQADIARVREAYARDPVAAQRFFEEAARNPEGVRRMFGTFAQGGSLITDEPVVGVGLRSRRPRFVVGEAGPEELRIRPLRRFADGGSVFTFTGLGSRLARLRQGLPGFSRTRSETASTGAASQTGQAVTPAQAAAMALGRAIRQALPLGRPDVADLVARLEAGQAPLPGSVSDWIVQHLDPVLRQGLNAVVEAFGILPEQFEASRRRFSVPGFVVTSIRR